jgi:hypothetical protein
MTHNDEDTWSRGLWSVTGSLACRAESAGGAAAGAAAVEPQQHGDHRWVTSSQWCIWWSWAYRRSRRGFCPCSAHSRTPRGTLKALAAEADVILVAAGVPGLVQVRQRPEVSPRI